jgi:hypothetical protein
MILWIASYPKSGNTWIRALISTYLFSNNGEFNFDLLLKIPKFIQSKNISPIIDLDQLQHEPLKISNYWKAAQARINLNGNINFLKTHNACVSYKNNWFTDETNSAGYIYIVRDPRAVASSLAFHSKISIKQSVDDLLNENQVGYNGPKKLAEISSSWKINYLSWKKKKKFSGLIIKYEDLIDNTEKEFEKILLYLKEIVKTAKNSDLFNLDDKDKILKSINSCNFSKLSKMEDLYGFKEATNDKFFRVGKKDSWKTVLNQDLCKKIELSFKDEMTELGYI